MSYANWLGDPSVSFPTNNVVVAGVPVNLVPIVLGTSSNLNTWSNDSFVTFFETVFLPAGTYKVGMEMNTDPLTASNAGAGWNQGDFFVGQITNLDGSATLALTNFVRPYTSGLQVDAVSPYNKGATNGSVSGIVVLPSDSTLKFNVAFGKDVTTAYPQTRRCVIESPYFQRIA